MKRRKNKYRCYLFLIAVIFSGGECFSQAPPSSFVFWKLQSISGELRAKGFYREQEMINKSYSENLKSSLGSAGLLLMTKSYFLHPNFMLIDINGEYSPTTSQDKYLVIPNRAEVNTVKKLETRATFFQSKKISLSVYDNLNESFSNRENLSNIKTNSNSWGGSLSYGNKFLPFSVGYNQSKWNQDEIQTGRNFNFEQKNLESRMNKSFGKTDRHELIFSHNESVYQDVGLPQIENTIDNLNLNNYFYFDSKKNYSFSSMILGSEQQGNDNYTRAQALESLNMRLPKKFNFTGGYNFFTIGRQSQQMNQHTVMGSIGHQLYESLHTNITYEYSNSLHTVYNEQRNKAGADIRYEKKIPTKGRLVLSYGFYRQNQKMQSSDAILQIKSEEYVLTDGQMVLLKKPYINVASVVVKDITGTIIYQLNFDYVLIDRDNFLEIQRVPGGQIPNNGQVYIDYSATQPGSYQYDIDNNSFSASISLFRRIIELYYRTIKQDNYNLEKTDFLTLNYLTQNVYGCRLEYKFANGGVEWDDYKSNIVPYRLLRYYVALQGNFHKKLSYSLNGNISDYQMIINEETKQTYSDIFGSIAFNFSPKARISLEVAYRNQAGQGIDLDLLTARSELTFTFRKLFFSAGVEIYKRNYTDTGEEINIRGVNVKMTRRF